MMVHKIRLIPVNGTDADRAPASRLKGITPFGQRTGDLEDKTPVPAEKPGKNIEPLDAVGDRRLPVPVHDLDLCFEATFGTNSETTKGNGHSNGHPVIELPAYEIQSVEARSASAANIVPQIPNQRGAIALLRGLAAQASSSTFLYTDDRVKAGLTKAALSIATAGRPTPMTLGDSPSEAERQRMLVNHALNYGGRRERAGAADGIIAEAIVYLGLGETRGQASTGTDMTDDMRAKLQTILSGDNLALKLEILELVVSAIGMRTDILEREAKANSGVKEEDLEKVLLKTSEIRNLRKLLSQILADESLVLRLEATRWLLENMGKLHYLKRSLGPIVRNMARKYFDDLDPEAVAKNPELEELHKNLLKLADLFSRKTPPIVISIDHNETECPAPDVAMLEEIRRARKGVEKIIQATNEEPDPIEKQRKSLTSIILDSVAVIKNFIHSLFRKNATEKAADVVDFPDGHVIELEC